MSDAAVRFARAIGYTNAGTAEFMLTARLFFLELNGRIQVEHPVTELVTGLDLVAEQLRIASGQAMSPVQDSGHGHAVEVRLYAEDPRTFLPQGGRITRLVLPRSIRVDAGIAEGDEVAIAYDPLLAKLIAHGATRRTRRPARDALGETVVEGVTTNLPFLLARRAPERPRGRTTTAFLVEHPPLPLAARQARPEWQGAWRLNRPHRHHPHPTDALAHEQAGARRARHSTDARHGDQGARRAGPW